MINFKSKSATNVIDTKVVMNNKTLRVLTIQEANVMDGVQFAKDLRLLEKDLDDRNQSQFDPLVAHIGDAWVQPKNDEAYLRTFTKECDGCVWLLIDGEHAIGMLHTAFAYDYRHVGNIRLFIIDKDYRNQRIGTGLFKFMLDNVEKIHGKLHGLFIRYYLDNLPAKKLYASFGFKPNTCVSVKLM